MSYLLDISVVSELMRSRPSAPVLRWFASVPNSALHLSVLTVGEIRAGVEGLKPGARREKLRLWLEQDLPAWFDDRLLPIDVAVAEHWGRLVAAARRTLPATDSLIAATALQAGLRLVTRNTSDFAFPDLDVVNPWEFKLLP